MEAIGATLFSRLLAVIEKSIRLSRLSKQIIVACIDLALILPSIWIAYSLRIGEWVYWNFAVSATLLGALILMPPIFYAAGVYHTIFRFAGAGMMKTIVRGFAVYTAAMVAIFMVLGFVGVPRTMGLLQPLIYFFLVAGSRLTARYVFTDLMGRRKVVANMRRVLVYGAGTAGQQIASAMRTDPTMVLVGYVDDDKRLHGQSLDGHKVSWSGVLGEVVKKTEANTVLLAMPQISRRRRRAILASLETFELDVRTLPPVSAIVGGEVSMNDIRPVEVEDLLGRETVAPNELLLGRTIIGQSVMVTGAGGSIGSELCRQIVRTGAKKLVLIDFSEFGLYKIERELKQVLAEVDAKPCPIVPILGSVTDAEKLRSTMRAHDVTTVYHAAAYKHVPLVEANTITGMRNNILGTSEAIQSAADAGVKNFILVSTDKAVRPTNVMGASKRAAEQVVQSFAEHNPKMRCSMVRFGNVLGSSGSVVPLFRSQIEAGGPITLTHKDITRYFMTIPEAANLVIQAGGLAAGGEVFVLDMGKPVRIYDLAKAMVQLSGLTLRDDKTPDGDIEIVEVGLRQGEKLYEELLIGGQPQKTNHPRIFKANEQYLAWREVAPILESIEQCSEETEALGFLQRLAPEFEHKRDNTAQMKAS